jgi:hypothetical protein
MENDDIGVRELCTESARIALEHGWKNDFPTQSLLAIGEICEAVEEFRDHRKSTEIWYSLTTKDKEARTTVTREVEASEPGAKPEGIPVELADAVIRIADWCGQNDVDLAAAIRLKMQYNRSRPFRHGGKKI